MVTGSDSDPGAGHAPAPAPGSPAPRPDAALTVAPIAAPAAAPASDPAIRRIQNISRWLDDRYLDPILGFLLPGLGDAVPALFGLYVLITAVRRRVPPVVLARMLLNIAGDALLGAIPILGDVFDIGFKAHQRNAALLVQRHGERRGTTGDWLLVSGAVVLLVAVLVVPIALTFWLANSAWDAMFPG